MPQDGSNNYYYPPGTPGVPDTTIESDKYNAFLDDLVTNDLNIARPIHRGGTGATTAAQALTNLGAEKAGQQVTNYDAHVFVAGSFWSAAATGSPSGYMSGVALLYDADNITLDAWSYEAGVMGDRFVRQKQAGTWLPWQSAGGTQPDLDARYVNVTGDTMTGNLNLNYLGPIVKLDMTAASNGATFGSALNGLSRWNIYLGEGVPETGGDSGSNFAIYPFSDAGVQKGPALTISRATGALAFGNAPTTLANLGALPLAGGTMTGAITGRGSIGTISDGPNPAMGFEVRANGAPGDACYIGFNRTGYFAGLFGLDYDNKWKVGGWSHGASAYELWHEGNFNPICRFRIFTSSDTYVPNSDLIYAIVQAQGAGGAGGGAQGSLNLTLVGAGGGAGAFSTKRLTAAEIGASQTVTIGAGGTGSFGSGGAGGASSFGSLCVAYGGAGGPVATIASLPTPASGGAAGTGDYAAGGSMGSAGLYHSNDGGVGLVVGCGTGGSSFFGGAATLQPAWSNSSNNGFSATGYGSGGGGGSCQNNTSTANGGAGYQGIVFVWEFCRK